MLAFTNWKGTRALTRCVTEQMSDAVLIAAITSGSALAALGMLLIAKPHWRTIKFGPLTIEMYGEESRE